jgi:hypothetical protein
VIRVSLSRYILYVLMVCLATPRVAASEASELGFLPDPLGDTTAILSGSTWIGTGPDFTLRLQRIDADERRAFIEKVTGSATDPFASPPDQRPGFVTFVMQLENQGAGSLVFRSQQAWLVTNKTEYLKPISMEGLKARYGLVGAQTTPAYENSFGAVVPTTVDLVAGQTLVGLLVYRAFKPKTKRYRLDIQLITGSGDAVMITLPYQREKKKDP